MKRPSLLILIALNSFSVLSQENVSSINEKEIKSKSRVKFEEILNIEESKWLHHVSSDCIGTYDLMKPNGYVIKCKKNLKDYQYKLNMKNNEVKFEYQINF